MFKKNFSVFICFLIILAVLPLGASADYIILPNNSNEPIIYENIYQEYISCANIQQILADGNGNIYSFDDEGNVYALTSVDIWSSLMQNGQYRSAAEWNGYIYVLCNYAIYRIFEFGIIEILTFQYDSYNEIEIVNGIIYLLKTISETNGYVASYNIETGFFNEYAAYVPINDYYNQINMYSDGKTIWIVSDLGLYYMDEYGHFRNYDHIAINNSFNFASGEIGLFITTDNALLKINNNGEVTNINIPDCDANLKICNFGEDYIFFGNTYTYLYDGEKFEDVNNIFRYEFINDILKIDDTVYAATMAGVYRIVNGKETFLNIGLVQKYLNIESIECLEGYLYANVNHSIARRKISESNWEFLHFKRDKSFYPVDIKMVDDEIYILFNNQFHLVTGDTYAPVEFKSEDGFVLEASNNTILTFDGKTYGSFNYGFYIKNGEYWSKITDLSVASMIFQSNNYTVMDDTIYMAYGDIVYKFVDHSWLRLPHYGTGSVRSMVTAGNEILISTKNYVYSYKEEDEKWSIVEGISNFPILNLYTAENGEVFAATASHVFKRYDKTFRVVKNHFIGDYFPICFSSNEGKIFWVHSNNIYSADLFDYSKYNALLTVESDKVEISNSDGLEFCLKDDQIWQSDISKFDFNVGSSYELYVRQNNGNPTLTGVMLKFTVPKYFAKAPVLSILSTEGTTVTLSPIIGGEYSADGGITWQNGNVFYGLAPDIPYSFTARLKETDTYEMSPLSAPVTVKIPKLPNKADSKLLLIFAISFGVLILLTVIILTIKIPKRKKNVIKSTNDWETEIKIHIPDDK